MVLSISQGGLPRSLFLWWDYCCRIWFQEAFSFFWVTSFLFFSFIFLCACFQHFRVLIIFLFFKHFNLFLICQFNSFCWLSFLIFIISMTHFSLPNSWWSSWFVRYFIHFQTLLSTFAVPYHWPFCYQSMP